ncbi:MAG: thiolase family protein [Thermoplasmata archaeon]|nr:thiolase family protein [Thermoplasmata archaeon]
MNCHITATGFARFGRRPEPLVELAAEAAGEALAGLGRKPVDFLVVGNMLSGAINGTENLVSRVANQVGLETAAGLRVEAASASGAAAFHAAVQAVEGGGFERVLVVAVEKMTDRPTAEVSSALAHSLHPSEQVVGATMPALAALVTQRYTQRYPTDPEVFDQVSVAARAASTRNPAAQFRAAVTGPEVRASRVVADPLHLLHCSAISDGAVAVVVERGEGPARVAGLGQAFEALALVDRSDLTTFGATRSAAERAFSSSGGSRKDVGVVEVHDAFSPFLLIDLEDLGFDAPGTASRRYSGDSVPDSLSVNPSGGILGRGHPVGASGLAGIAEVARQLRGEAGTTQLDPRPQFGLAHSIGGLASHNFVTLLGRAVG